MGRRRRDANVRRNGLVLIIVGLILGVVLFVVGQTETNWSPRVTLTTDFRTITGLRKDSIVQIAGVEIGKVKSIDFITDSYPCDPATEDMGRHGVGGRTDDCDPAQFCAPEGQCAELEQSAGRAMHAPCIRDEHCSNEEICYTKVFRRRYKRVFFAAGDDVCARFTTSYRRVRVTMRIDAERLDLIRSDSRATVATNSVLGDQLVNITPGQGDPIPAGGRVASTPSLYEDIEAFRVRVEGFTDKLDEGLASITDVFGELNDERAIAKVKGVIADLNETTRQMANGEGTIGAMFADPRYKADFTATLARVRGGADGVDDFVRKADRQLAKVEDGMNKLESSREDMAKLRKKLDTLKDPDDRLAGLVYDHNDGQAAKDLGESIAHVKAVLGKVERGEGSAGRLIDDPKVNDALVKKLEEVQDNKLLMWFIRLVQKSGDKKRK